MGSVLSSCGARSYSSEGLGAAGLAMPGVNQDPIADPGGPPGIKGKHTNSTPAGTPLDSVGPKDGPKGVGGPKIEYIDS